MLFRSGMKPTQEGPTIGKAMQDFDPAKGLTAEGIIPCPAGTPRGVICGKVYVFINVSWTNPSVMITSNGNLSQQGKPVSIATVLADSTSQQSATESAVVTQSITELQMQVASISSQLRKIDDLSKQLADLQKQLPLLTVLTASSSASMLSNTDATISGTLSVLGKTLLSDIGVTGKLTAGLLTIDGMDSSSGTAAASINTLSGPLKLQSLALGGLDILSGKVTIDTNGNIQTSGIVTAKKYNVDTSDSASASVGEATLPAGQTRVEVKTSAITDTSKIFATPKKLPIPVSTDITGKQTFEIDIKEPLQKNLQIDWWVVN